MLYNDSGDRMNKTKDNKLELHNSISGTIVFFLYFIMTNLQALPLILLGIDTSRMSDLAKGIYLISYQVIMIVIFMLLFKDIIFRCFKDFKDNFKKYTKEYFKYWYILFGLMILSNVVIFMIKPGSMAANQVAINQSFVSMPIYTYISAVILAPFIEELMFRQSLRNIFKSDKFFIFISGFLFGGMHVFSSMSSWFDLLYLFPYCIPGFIFAYVLVKSKNIFIPIGLHFFHNGLLMSLQVILLLAGYLS